MDYEGIPGPREEIGIALRCVQGECVGDGGRAEAQCPILLSPCCSSPKAAWRGEAGAPAFAATPSTGTDDAGLGGTPRCLSDEAAGWWQVSMS